MHNSLDVDANIGVLEPADPLPAHVTMRKERERVTRNLFQDRIVVAAGKWHRVCAHHEEVRRRHCVRT